MKNLLKVLSVLILINFVNACGTRVSSPMIWITNQSDNYINNININWNGYDLGTNNYPKSPGYGGAQNFTLEKKSDIYGPVHIEWENAEGKKIIKDFEFTKAQLPNFRKGRGWLEFDYAVEDIYFFLTQSDMKMLIDPTGMGSEEIKKEQQIANKFSEYFIKICPKQHGCDLSKKRR